MADEQVSMPQLYKLEGMTLPRLTM